VLGVGCGGGKETNSGTLIQTGSTKTCYWCKESIKAAALVCKHCGKNPSSPSAQAIEKAIRQQLKKPTGELTKADLEKVWSLYLAFRQLTNVKGLEKLTQLTVLYLDGNQLTDVTALKELTQLTVLSLHDNPDLTKAQIDELQKALPKCKISSDFY
jgi:hypothetical protein